MSLRAPLALASASLVACSLVTSLDGYTGGSRAPTDAGAADAAVREGGAVADAGAGVDASTDGGDSGDADCSDPSLLAYWPMNEGAGQTVADCTGRYPATMSANTKWSTRGASPAVAFDGVDAQLDIGVVNGLDPSGALTLAAFFRYEQNPTGYASVFWNFVTSRGYEMTQDGSGKLYVSIATGPGGLSFPTFPPAAWHHVAMVYTPSTSLELFFDGASVARSTTSIPASIPQGTDLSKHMGVVFGGGSNTFFGAVDDVRIYGRALSATEIADLATR